MVAFFNQKLDINRFFIEDSDTVKNQIPAAGNEMPKVEFGASDSGPSNGFGDNSDPFEDDLEDALCVFKSGDGNADILEKNENLIMFYVDLDNEQIISKPNSGEESKQQANDMQETESKHPVLFNQYPVCENHSLFLLFADAGLP